MGIQGLLKALAPIGANVNVSSYSGERVGFYLSIHLLRCLICVIHPFIVAIVSGIDAYCWLHRGAFHYSTEICLQVPVDGYIQYCMRRVALLQEHQVSKHMYLCYFSPYVILDNSSFRF